MSAAEAAKQPQAVAAKAPAAAVARTGGGEPAPSERGSRTGSPTRRATAKEAATAKPRGQGKAGVAGGEAVSVDGKLSAAEQGRLAAVEGRLSANKTSATTHESAEDGAQQARDAAKEPAVQTQGVALVGQAGELVENAPPDPEIVKTIDKLKVAIRSKRPLDEKELGKADPQAMAQAAGQGLAGDIKAEVKTVETGYEPIGARPEGTATKEVSPLPGVAAAPPAPAIQATQATPDAVTPQEVSLDTPKKDVAKDTEKAQLGREEMGLVKDGPIPEARAAKAELEDLSIWGPDEVLKTDKDLRASAHAAMKTAEAAALAEMRAARATKLAATEKDKAGHATGEEAKRAQFGKELQEIYETAEDRVRAKLKPMVPTALAKWDDGIKPLSVNFDRALKRVDKWIKDRNDSILDSTIDFFAGLPGWIVKEYETAETAFMDGAGELAKTLSSWVNGIIRECQKIIADARKEMAEKTAGVEPALAAYALAEQARLGKQFDALGAEVTLSQRSFTQQLGRTLTTSVNEKRKQIADLRERSKGLWQRAKDAINAVIDDPLKAMIDGVLSLLGIPPAAFWAMIEKFKAVIADIKDKPRVFANNLVAAIKKGFEQFSDNIGTHLLKGLLTWLTSKLKDAGVQAPADFSLKSMLTLFLQILGVSWAKIRQKLVKYIGEKNMKRIELAVQLVTTFMREGWDGLYKLLKEKLNPQILVDAVLGAVKKFIIEEIVKQAALRIIGMFNPAGAIAQALQLIYDAVVWIVDNAARIFTFLEAIVNGAANIMAGAIGGAANMIEKALGMLVPIVIDLFAKILGLGGLPDKVKEVVGRLQATVDQAIDKAIEWLASKVGLSKEKDKGDDAVGETVPFTGGGEGHKIYFEVSGDNATLMVASQPMTVEARLANFRMRLPEIIDLGRRREADERIQEAVDLVSKADSDADKLVRIHRKEEEAEDVAQGEAEDEAVVAQQTKLAKLLSELYELFGENPGNVLLKMRASYQGHAGHGELSFQVSKAEAALLSSGPFPGQLGTEMAAFIAMASNNTSAKNGAVKAQEQGADTEVNATQFMKSEERKEETKKSLEKSLDGTARALNKVAVYRRISPIELIQRAEAMIEKDVRDQSSRFETTLLEESKGLSSRIYAARAQAIKDVENLKKGKFSKTTVDGTTIIRWKGGGHVARMNNSAYPEIMKKLLGAEQPLEDSEMTTQEAREQLAMALIAKLHFIDSPGFSLPKTLEKYQTFVGRLGVLQIVEAVRARGAYTVIMVQLIELLSKLDSAVSNVFDSKLFTWSEVDFVKNYRKRGPEHLKEGGRYALKKLFPETGDITESQPFLTLNELKEEAEKVAREMLKRVLETLGEAAE